MCTALRPFARSKELPHGSGAEKGISLSDLPGAPGTLEGTGPISPKGTRPSASRAPSFHKLVLQVLAIIACGYLTKLSGEHLELPDCLHQRREEAL